ncbi:MAG TPA: DegT/DnrJ/EryC1/StrS family aminotransferase, partial [Solirubrobacterales bacterium]|nr:DegT/DnrJ/EryC1/StrS family aminotransferase [Solirubrobacterales bacterium]
LSDLAAALGVAQVEKLDSLLARRAEVARLYEQGLAGLEGVETPIAGRGSERRSWFVYVVRLPDGVDRDATIDRLAERGVASKAYLPCIHLFPHLRELGYREGQFPVAEAAAAHSLALPFFPGIGEGQVDRACQELAAALGQVA